MLDVQLRRENEDGRLMAIFASAVEQGVGGALVRDPRRGPTDNGALVYLDADGKLEASLARVERAGGNVLMPKTDIGPPGFIALVRDSEGNVVGDTANAVSRRRPSSTLIFSISSISKPVNRLSFCLSTVRFGGRCQSLLLWLASALAVGLGATGSPARNPGAASTAVTAPAMERSQRARRLPGGQSRREDCPITATVKAHTHGAFMLDETRSAFSARQLRQVVDIFVAAPAVADPLVAGHLVPRLRTGARHVQIVEQPWDNGYRRWFRFGGGGGIIKMPVVCDDNATKSIARVRSPVWATRVAAEKWREPPRRERRRDRAAPDTAAVPAGNPT